MRENNTAEPKQQLPPQLMQISSALREEDMDQKCLCRGTQIQLLSGEDYVNAQVCSCMNFEQAAPKKNEKVYYRWDESDDHLEISPEEEAYNEARRAYSRAEKKAESFTNAKIPNRYCNALNESFYSEEVIACLPKKNDLASNQETSLYFFYGEPGTGKTQAGVFLLMHFLQANPEKKALYFNAHELVEMKRSTSYSFDARVLKDETEFMYQKTLKRLKAVDYLVFDELGQKRLSETETTVIFDILDYRYASNKTTILISNHSDNIRRTLDKKTLSSLVGKRISSRIKSAKSVFFLGKDHRENKQNEIDTHVSDEEKANFNMGAASPKLLTLDENTHHIMNWLTRVPAFETVSAQRRKELTDPDSNEDKERPSPSEFKDVFIRGDSLKVRGPVCDQEDMKVYAALVKELVRSHKLGLRGVNIQLSYSDLLRICGTKKCGDAVLAMRRRLDRLNRMHLTFSNLKGHSWAGALLTTVSEVGKANQRKVDIEFNKYMIAFYRLQEYVTFDAEKFWSLSGDSAALFIFYASHEFPEQHLGFPKIQRLLAIPDTTSQKAVDRRITKAFRNVLETGLLDMEQSKLERRMVHTYRANRLGETLEKDGSH